MDSLRQILTQKELKTRNQFLVILLLFFSLSIFSLGVKAIQFFGGQVDLRHLLLYLGSSSINIFWLIFAYLFCYRKATTFLLTMHLVAACVFGFFFLNGLVFMAFQTGNPVSLPMIIFGSIIFMPGLWVYYTVFRFRKVNKILQCFVKYPTTSEEIIQIFKDYTDLDTLLNAYNQYLELHPKLQYLIERQYYQRKKELKSVQN